MTDITALKELLEAATPGPWQSGHLSDETAKCNCPYIYSDHQHGMGSIASVGTGEEDVRNLAEAAANQKLIVALRNSAPDLIARLERAEADARRYRWLRDIDSDGWPAVRVPCPCSDDLPRCTARHTTPLRHAALDAAIDAAMAAEGSRSDG